MNAAKPAADPAARTPVRVLLVEDDMVDRMACRRALAADPLYAFELIEADTAQQGLLAARAERPDCILLDYQLPDLSGLEFLAHLAGARETAGIPVTMLTGADSAAVAADAMRRGARDYLVKDVERHYLELLPAGIGRMLREQRLLDEKRQIEAKFRTLVEQIPAITYIASLGETDALLYISPQIRTLGYSPEAWLAAPSLLERQLHEDDRDAAMQAIRTSRSAGLPLHLEYRLATRNGTVLWFRDEAEVVLDEAGQKLFMQGVLLNITRDKLAEQALRQTQDELRRLAAHQENIKEHERKRIAQEIHDELGGLLTGINAYISVAIERAAAAGAPAEPLLQEAAGLTKDAIDTVRKVITDLRPSVLDQLGIWDALEWHAGQITQRSGLQCACAIEAAAGALCLDAERSTMVFRVVQEALTNVVRHAQATRVAIEVGCSDGVLQVSVRDDGRGIETERLLNGQSWGILGMIERTRHFGGELKITGEPGRGTALVLRLPLEDADGR